jgi:hypothetical protein
MLAAVLAQAEETNDTCCELIRSGCHTVCTCIYCMSGRIRLLPALPAPSEKGIPRIGSIVRSATGEWSLVTQYRYMYSYCLRICVSLARRRCLFELTWRNSRHCMSLFAKSSCPASIEYQHEIVSPEYLRHQSVRIPQAYRKQQ